MARARRRSTISRAQFAFARAIVLLYLFHTGQRFTDTKITMITRRLLRALPKRIANRFHRDTSPDTMHIVRDLLRRFIPHTAVPCP